MGEEDEEGGVVAAYAGSVGDGSSWLGWTVDGLLGLAWMDGVWGFSSGHDPMFWMYLYSGVVGFFFLV